MRHGNAELKAASDSARQLTSRGRQECLAMAEQLTPCVNLVSKVIASPYVRAQQSAKIVADSLGGIALETNELITPDVPATMAVRALEAELEQGVIIVSHLPLVSSLVSLLVQGHAQENYPFVTAGCAHLVGEHWVEGGLSLKQFFYPQ